MTKVHLFANIAGKSAKYSNDYFCDNYAEQNGKMVDEIYAKVVKLNETNDRKLTIAINKECNLVELSNGQTFRLRNAPKVGQISVHSDHIKACGVRIDKTDIDPTSICEDSFRTIYGSTVKFW